MKISTRGRYALRLMMDVAVFSKDAPVRIKDVAQRQQISEKYLEQIESALNKAGFVKSSRGPQGGYRLMKKPEDYTTGMILRLIEGSRAPVACMDGDINECGRRKCCATLKLWQMLNEAIENVVDHVTLADLVTWQQEMEQNCPDK